MDAVPYYLYIIRCANDALYVGIAKDLQSRLKTHESGQGSKYVRSHLPFKLVYFETLNGRSDATKREIEIKRLPKYKKEELLLSRTNQLL